MDEFERAAKSLCDKVKNDSNVTKNVTYYYGALVRVSLDENYTSIYLNNKLNKASRKIKA